MSTKSATLAKSLHTVTARDVRPVLRVGSLAIADRFNYLVPCKVLDILPAWTDHAIGKDWPTAPGSQEVRVMLTATRGAYYTRGRIISLPARDCYPRGAFFPRRHGARIGYYTVEAPGQASA